MNTEIILKRFKKLLSMEEKAKRYYNYYIERLEDAEIKKHLISICDDEKKHIDIVKKLITLIS